MTTDDIKREAEEIVKRALCSCSEDGRGKFYDDISPQEREERDENDDQFDHHDTCLLFSNGIAENDTVAHLEAAISQALLSSRDQGYQEGVEDTVKAFERVKDQEEQHIKKHCASERSCSTTSCSEMWSFKIRLDSFLASLKDKLKPKEKV